MTDNYIYIAGLCCDEVPEWVMSQIASDLDKKDAEIAELKQTIEMYKELKARLDLPEYSEKRDLKKENERLRKGIEDWLKRMDYYTDNQYGKREMKELLK